MRRTFNKVVFRLRQDNFALAICVVLSIVLWLVIQLSKSYETPRSVNIEYRVPPGLTFTQEPPSSMVAVVQGSGWKLLRSYFRQSTHKLTIDLQAYEDKVIEKSELFQLLSNEIGLPVVNANTSYLVISMDSTTTKEVPVVFDNRISLAKDFFFSGDVKISPSTVVLTGPKEQLARVTEVRTRPSRLTNVSRNVQQEVYLIPPEVDQVRLNRKKVLVSIPVEQFTELEFNLSVSVPEEIGEFEVIPKTVKLHCITKLSAAREISESDFTVGIVEREIGQDPNSAYVPLQIIQKPDFVKVTGLSTNAVELFRIK